MRSYIFIVILFILISCKSEKKEEIILDSRYLPKHVMIDIIKEIHLADAALSILQPRYNNDKKFTAVYYYNYIFKKHNITKDYFEKNVLYYSLYPQVFEEVYDSVQIEISKLQVTQEIFDDK
ncbi:MAG: hypothetical protein A2046_02575 [Bacteroidetes bacterium GWA2_30_7]|nr:MAG: hypothetical protein A2046_02575 [Bacteroidetes bacterium GWA2_30_7]